MRRDPITLRLFALTVASALAAGGAVAQEQAAEAEPAEGGATATASQGPFAGFRHDSSAPIEVTSDALEVRQGEQIAVFTGDVVAGQGTLRLASDTMTVSYGGNDPDQTGEINSIVAEGNVFLANESETAEGARAEYDVVEGMLRMWGDVIVTQGQNAISGESLVIDLKAGTGRIESAGGERVKSVFTPAGQ